MKNTKIEYLSSEQTPVVYPEMDELLPALHGEEFSALEKDILENGCYTPITVNEDMVIIDGHNRFRICQKHGIPFRMQVFHFDDLLEAKQWALDTQKGRRNLDKWELGKIALRLKPEIEARAKANMAAGGGDHKSNNAKSGLPKSADPILSIDTRQEMADAVGIGKSTMGQIMQIDKHAPEVVKEALDKKELSINRGYTITKEIQQLPEDQREQAAKEAIRRLDAMVDQRTKIANVFCKAYERAVLLKPTSENVRIWTECTRMTPDELEDSVYDSYELAEKFHKIGDIIKDEILPTDWHFRSPAYAEKLGVFSAPDSEKSA